MAWADTLNYEPDFDVYYDPNDQEAGFYSLVDGYYWDYSNTYAYDRDGNERVLTNTQTPSQNNSGSFFGDLWNGVKSYATNKDVINQALGGLTGYNVNNNPNPTKPINTVIPPPPQKSNNTALYIIGGVLVVGMIVTIIVVTTRKK